MVWYIKKLMIGLGVLALTSILGGCVGTETGSSSSSDSDVTSSSSIPSSSSVTSSSNVISSSSSAPSSDLDGQALYNQQCLHCHGDENGKDVELGGALTAPACDACGSHEMLALEIETTMPAGKPADCDAECSEAIAHYILDNFLGYAGNQSGAQLYQAQCQSCHGDGSTSVGLTAAQLVPSACTACAKQEDLSARIHTTMPFKDAAKCQDDCADKIAEYIFTSFPEYDDLDKGEPLNPNLARPIATIENNGNDVLVKWQPRTQAPSSWYLERWNEDTALWDKVALLDGDKTQYRHTNHHSGYYRLYSITDTIASFPAYLRGDLYVVHTKGKGIYNTSDGFNFQYQEVTGNFTAEVTIESDEIVVDWKKIGLMARASLDANAKHISALMSPLEGTFIFARPNAGDKAVSLARQETKGLGTIRLQRAGNNFTVSYQQAGSAWKTLDTKTQAMPNKVYLGLATTSRHENVETKTIYSNLKINNNQAPSLTSRDIGATSRVSRHPFSNGDNSAVALNPFAKARDISYLAPKNFANQINDTFPGNKLWVANQLPQGDSTSGYKVGVELSTLDVEKIHNVAKTVSDKIAAAETAKIACPLDSSQRCAEVYIRRMAESFSRRPISSELVTQLYTTYSKLITDYGKAQADEGLFEALTQMPNFIYLGERTGYGMPAGTIVPVTGYEMAARLASTIWASSPDAELLQKAELGELSTPAQIRAQAARLMKDYKAKRSFQNFYHQWLHLEELSHKEKNINGVTFNSGVAYALTRGLDAYVEHVVFSGDTEGTFDSLMTEPLIGTSAKIQQFTGVNSSSNTPEVRSTVGVQGGQRQGLLAQPALLALLADKERGSIIERGVFVNTQFLCAGFPPAPDNVPAPDSIDPIGKTWREIYEELTQKTGCIGCHKFINPIGATMEHFDGVGRYRTQDRNKNVDVMANILSRTTGNVDAAVNGLPELNTYLATSEKAKACFAQQYLTYAVGRGLSNEDRSSIDWLVDTMNDKNWKITEMLIETTQTPAFIYRKVH